MSYRYLHCLLVRSVEDLLGIFLTFSLNSCEMVAHLGLSDMETIESRSSSS